MGDKQEIWDLYDRNGNRTGETFVRAFGNYKRVDKEGLLDYVNSEHTMTNHNNRYKKYLDSLV